MRTLFVCDSPPFPLDSGSHQRVYHLLKALARISEVTLLCGTPEGDLCPELEAIRSLYKRVFPFRRGDRAREFSGIRAWVWLKVLFKYHLHPVEPALVRINRSAEAEQRLAELLTRDFDLVWVETMAAMSWLPPTVRSRVVVDLYDLEHRKLERELRNGLRHRFRLLHAAELLKMRRFEKGLVRRPYEYAVCSEIDRRALGGGQTVWVIPNGTELPLPGERIEGGNPVVLFCGTLFYGPNVDAIKYFSREVWPRIRREEPRAKFLVVGRQPSPEVMRLHDNQSVTVIGPVPDVGPYYRQAAVVVAPIRFGGGTRIKILEALGHRKAVVSTTLGAEGLDVQHGKHLLIADTPAGFAQACASLLRDSAARRRLGEGGFALVQEQYQWSSIERRVQELATCQGHNRFRG
jgi:polysaccharide biosynthesis protein PslH